MKVSELQPGDKITVSDKSGKSYSAMVFDPKQSLVYIEGDIQPFTFFDKNGMNTELYERDAINNAQKKGLNPFSKKYVSYKDDVKPAIQLKDLATGDKFVAIINGIRLTLTFIRDEFSENISHYNALENTESPRDLLDLRNNVNREAAKSCGLDPNKVEFIVNSSSNIIPLQKIEKAKNNMNEKKVQASTCKIGDVISIRENFLTGVIVYNGVNGVLLKCAPDNNESWVPADHELQLYKDKYNVILDKYAAYRWITPNELCEIKQPKQVEISSCKPGDIIRYIGHTMVVLEKTPTQTLASSNIDNDCPAACAVHLTDFNMKLDAKQKYHPFSNASPVELLISASENVKIKGAKENKKEETILTNFKVGDTVKVKNTGKVATLVALNGSEAVIEDPGGCPRGCICMVGYSSLLKENVRYLKQSTSSLELATKKEEVATKKLQDLKPGDIIEYASTKAVVVGVPFNSIYNLMVRYDNTNYGWKAGNADVLLTSRSSKLLIDKDKNYQCLKLPDDTSFKFFGTTPVQIQDPVFSVKKIGNSIGASELEVNDLINIENANGEVLYRKNNFALIKLDKQIQYSFSIGSHIKEDDIKNLNLDRSAYYAWLSNAETVKYLGKKIDMLENKKTVVEDMSEELSLEDIKINEEFLCNWIGRNEQLKFKYVGNADVYKVFEVPKCINDGGHGVKGAGNVEAFKRNYNLTLDENGYYVFITNNNKSYISKIVKLKNPKNGFKSELTCAWYRVASTQLTSAIKFAILQIFKKDGMQESKLNVVKELLETPIGDALISYGLGHLITHVPGINQDERVAKLATEFRINGMATAGNHIIDASMQYIIPALKDAIKSLPTEVSTPETIHEEKEEIEIIEERKAS